MVLERDALKAAATFLNGITRQRVIQLLRTAGVEVIERTVRVEELPEADEIFSTGNHGKVVACPRYEERAFAPGPLAARARELHASYAHSRASAPIDNTVLPA